MDQFPNPMLVQISEKLVIGKKTEISLANFNISEIWEEFSPKIKEIRNRVFPELLSITIYQPGHFENFSIVKTFEKWAGAEVESLEKLPQGLDHMVIPAGEYAVFHYKGLPSDNRIFQWIYSQWLPASEFELDQRPHFEVLGEKYKNGSPDSEEDIYIPVKRN
ncbi:GyrI-like domain-containing protein [Algoriphagus sp. PAP.12]|uniref:GyrI-like domain-containing protein n=1 Tax=Algoriphagus sp. PAP.12 TaxID=2996678 RepID=UPI00227ADB92|nr:GyrI-like domain-containing protein [Algoriphagus sp. PAP.12]